MVSQRRRLGDIIVATLHLVLGVLGPLPRSAAVHEQALGFVESHARTWVRLLHDVCHVGTRCVACCCLGRARSCLMPPTRVASVQGT